jgi:hypothetical protein
MVLFNHLQGSDAVVRTDWGDHGNATPPSARVPAGPAVADGHRTWPQLLGQHARFTRTKVGLAGNHNIRAIVLCLGNSSPHVLPPSSTAPTPDVRKQN